MCTRDLRWREIMRGTVSRLATAARTRDEALELGAHALDAHGRTFSVDAFLCASGGEAAW